MDCRLAFVFLIWSGLCVGPLAEAAPPDIVL